MDACLSLLTGDGIINNYGQCRTQVQTRIFFLQGFVGACLVCCSFAQLGNLIDERGLNWRACPISVKLSFLSGITRLGLLKFT